MRQSLFRVLVAGVWTVHVLWTLLLAAGIALIFVVSWYAPIHLIFVSGTLLLNLALRDCPLTVTERVLRHVAGRSIERRSFTERLLSMLGWRLSSHGVNVLLIAVKVGSYTTTILVMAL